MLNKNLALEKVKDIIKQEGYISLAHLMQIALQSQHGYYQNYDPFSKNNQDFITSPQISSIFGELIGLWFSVLLDNKLNNTSINLIELGAGSGLLMFDILTILKNIKPNLQINVYFLEINSILIAQQKQKLQTLTNIKTVQWFNNIDNLVQNLDTSNQNLFFANEFFDAIECEQFYYINNVLYKQFFIINNNKIVPKLLSNFTKVEQIEINKYKPFLKNNDILEYSFKTKEIFSKISSFIKKYNGLFLIIDYGTTSLANKHSSIRGYKNNKLLNLSEILENLGNVDITYNVNFSLLEHWADSLDVNRINTITQADFLNSLGFKERLNIVKNKLILKNEKNLDLIIDNHLKLIDTNNDNSMIR